MLAAALAWAPQQGWRAGIEGRRYIGQIFVNDHNQDFALAYFVGAVHAGYRLTLRTGS